MKGFVLDEKQRDELARLNEGRADRQLAPVPLKDEIGRESCREIV
jgi:hypothetical protein